MYVPRRATTSHQRRWLRFVTACAVLLVLGHAGFRWYFAQPVRLQGSFQSLGHLPLRASAAAGLAVLQIDRATLLLAVCSFYGTSTPVFELHLHKKSLSALRVALLQTHAAHDSEALILPRSRKQLVVASYEGNSSIVYDLVGGALKVAQELPTKGASCARHFSVGAWHYLLLCNYMAANSVALYQWMGTAWAPVVELAVAGVSEATHCVLPDGQHLVILSTWFAHGSFAASSYVYTFDANAAQPFTLMQELATTGAHDVECFSRQRETFLLVANARDDAGRRDVSSQLLRYEGGRFRRLQELATLGAHDIEVFEVSGFTMVAVANQGDGRSCEGAASVDIYTLLPSGHLEVRQRIYTPCVTFLRALPTLRGMLLFVAVERHGSDPSNAASYDADALVLAWT